MFKKITLKDGLRILTIPNKNTRAVTVLVLVGAGSKYETKKINGISHFLEHMYFAGTKKRPTTIAVAETLDRVGGIYNAFTSEEYTGYYAKVDVAHFELALDWVSDIYLNSRLPEKEIRKEKGVIIEEINMYQDEPKSHVQVLWSKLLYGDQPAGWPVAGEKKSVSAISRNDLLAYMKSQYVAENTIVCVAGNLKDEFVVDKVRKYFSQISKTSSKEKPKVIEVQSKPAQLIQFRKTDQTNLCLGVRGYDTFHPQRFAFEILALILGGAGMMSSRLFEEIRIKLGIAYYVNASAYLATDAGYLVTQAGIDNKNVETAIKTILREYKKLSKFKVSEQELKKAKDFIKGKTILELETSDAQAVFYGGQEVLEKNILTPEEVFEKIDKVSQSDILKVAKDIFQPQKLNLALIGPFKDGKRFEKILKL